MLRAVPHAGEHLPVRAAGPAFLVAVLVAFSPVLSGSQSEARPTDLQKLTEFAVRYAAAWSSQDPEAFSLFYAENGSLRVNDGEPSTGRDAIAETAAGFMAAYPDMVVRLVELRRAGDRVEFHWHWTGTNTGPGGTGNAVDLRGHEIWTLDEDGLILESLGYYDEAEYERQLQADQVPRIHVLGVAQDAGYPQAGCYQPHCMPGWKDRDLRITASSIAVVDPANRSKLLFEATPDIAEQLYRLHRVAPDDEYSLDGVFLTHAHIGHYAGLMFFGHEAMGARRVPVFAMPRLRSFLSANGPWDQLVRYGNIDLQSLEHDSAVAFDAVTITPFLVPHRDEYSETVGYRIRGPKKAAVFIPDIDKWQDWETDIRTVVRGVDYALLDATFFADGELPGRDMSQVRHPFVSESMELFASLTAEEKSRVIFIHMNHTNPALRAGSEARQRIEEAGFRVAFEGMQLEL